MAVWVIRAGRHGEYEAMSIERGVTAVGFGLARSVDDFVSREALQAELPETSANQLWRFRHELRLVLPCKHTRAVAVGRVTGEYVYSPDLCAEAPHARSVEWAATNVPRSDFDQDLLNSFGALSTVSQPHAQNAEARIDAVVRAYLGQADDPDLVGGADLVPEADPNGELDLDQEIKDRIVARLKRKFAGLRLEHLVASILRASDYEAVETATGPDGGVDIVAGRGELGFGQPRLCVQVKARRGPVGLPEYDRLLGNLGTFSAEHGLLVSLGGFTKPVHPQRPVVLQDSPVGAGRTGAAAARNLRGSSGGHPHRRAAARPKSAGRSKRRLSAGRRYGPICSASRRSRLASKSATAIGRRTGGAPCCKL